MPSSLAAQLGLAAYLLICGFALWRGDRVLRLTAGAVLLEDLAYMAAWKPSEVFSRDPVLFGLDVALLAALIAIAWRQPRQWLVAAGGLQILCTFVHPLAALTGTVRERALTTALLASSYGVLACVLFGAVEAELTRHREARAEAAREADRWLWRSRDDADAAAAGLRQAIEPLRGRPRRRLEAALIEVERRNDAERPYRGDVATRMLNRAPPK